MRRRPPALLWIILAALTIGLVLLVSNHDLGRTFGLKNHDFAELLRAGVLITVLSAGVIAVRGSFGEIARNLAIWLTIMLALMTGYIYRYELQDIASRISAGIVPGSPLSITDSAGRVTVRLDRLGNGHFEAHAFANEKPVRLMIDTGASSIVLTAKDAHAIGIDVGALMFTTPVATANGVTTAARTQIETLSIGNIKRSRMPVLVAQEGKLFQSLLGMSFMGTLSGYDVRGDRMTLRD